MTAADDGYAIALVDRLDCSFEPRPWDFARSRAADIDSHWAARTAASPKLFNGRVLLQHRAAIETVDGSQVFRGAYLETDFKAFIAWRDFGCPDRSVRNCFALGALRGADGGFIVGEMAAHTANAGRVYFPAGTPDPQDVVAGKVDLAGSVLRELAEETGIGGADVTIDPGWMLLVGDTRIACLRTLRAHDDAAALVQRIHAYLADDPEAELVRAHVVRGMADAAALDMPDFMSVFFRAAFAEDQGG
jgi:8-oxo-dGTP pyrophosphatase MutT (NUDIX family)